MALNGVESPVSVFTEDSATEYDFTPTASTCSNQREANHGESRKLRVGHTYIIRSITCGRQLTLYKGEVILADANSLGSAYWICEETNGWLGFRNLASNKFLQHGGNDLGMCCTNDKHQLFEQMQVRPHEEIDGGYTIFSEFWGGLRPMGLIKRNGKEVLARNPAGGVRNLAWMFIEVHRELE